MDNITDDAQLVMQVWNCDSDAFGELATKYQRPLFHLIYGLISNTEDAEDSAQEALLRTYRAMKERKAPDDPAKFWPFLRQVARNIVMDLYRYRRMHNERMEELVEQLTIPDDPIGDMELQELVGKLPRNERTVILMYYIKGYSVDEIAEILGYKQPWVSKKKRRGEELLRKSLERGYREAIQDE